MGKLEKYTSYKDSGVEWLGEIPEHWQTQKMKYLGKMFAGLTDKKGDDFSKEISEDKKPFIPFTNVCNNVKIDSNQMQYVKVKPYEKQNKVQKNDIIFLMSSETLDDIGKCSIHLDEEQFYLNSFCKGFRPKAFAVNAEFLNYLLQSKTYRNYFALVGRGFTRINIKQEYINDLFTVLPPKEEQTKIASFLDEKTSQIDKAISQKEKLIELLKERRQITINEAVTKGLDKAVEFKDSGVEWIGEIPKHWEIIRSKRLFQQRKDRARKGDKQLTASQKYGVIFQDKFMELEGRKVTQVEHNYEILKRAEKGDFLISMRSFQGGIEYCRETGSVSSAYVALIPIKHVVPEYFKYLLKSQKYITALSSTSNLVRDGQALRFENFSMVDLLVIPEDEQVQIAEYIDKQTAKIDKAIELQQNYIAKLKEYKASLIDSVVTGKVKV